MIDILDALHYQACESINMGESDGIESAFRLSIKIVTNAVKKHGLSLEDKCEQVERFGALAEEAAKATLECDRKYMFQGPDETGHTEIDKAMNLLRKFLGDK